MRGRGSLALPLIIRFVNPREKSSLSSVLMTSCLKENPDIMWALDTEVGAGIGTPLTGSAESLAASGALSEFCVGTVVSSSSVGRTFLTTRRTTLTTFLRVRAWSSALSIWLVPVSGWLILPFAVPLAMLLATVPFCSCLLLRTGFGLKGACGGSGLLICAAVFDSGSGLLKRSGTLTGVLTCGGEGLLTRATDSAAETGGGLFARNNPLPGSRAGTDLARLESPSLSDYSQHRKGRTEVIRMEIISKNPSTMSLY